MDIGQELFQCITKQAFSEEDLLGFLETIPNDQIFKLQFHLFTIPFESVNTIILNFLRRKKIVSII